MTSIGEFIMRFSLCNPLTPLYNLGWKVLTETAGTFFQSKPQLTQPFYSSTPFFVIVNVSQETLFISQVAIKIGIYFKAYPKKLYRLMCENKSRVR